MRGAPPILTWGVGRLDVPPMRGRIVLQTTNPPRVRARDGLLIANPLTRKDDRPFTEAVLRICASAVPAHLGTPPLTIGPADRSLSKSGDAETVAQKIRPDVGAYVRCADGEVRSVALVFLF
jgi:hypothetical protein